MAYHWSLYITQDYSRCELSHLCAFGGAPSCRILAHRGMHVARAHGHAGGRGSGSRIDGQFPIIQDHFLGLDSISTSENSKVFGKHWAVVLPSCGDVHGFVLGITGVSSFRCKERRK